MLVAKLSRRGDVDDGDADERRMAWRATVVEVAEDLLYCWTLGRDHEAPRPVGVTKAVVDPSKRASSGIILEAKGAIVAAAR